MITFLSHDGIDKSRWDEAIAQSYNGLIYAQSWYLDIVSPEWSALINENYESVLPLTGKRKYSFNYLFPPFFTQQLGLFSKHTIDADLLGVFIAAIPNSYKYIEMQLNAYNPDPGGFKVQQRKNHLLNLEDSYETICSAYSENHTRSLRRAEREGVQINKEGNVRDVIRLFRQGKGATIKNLKDKEYLMFEKLAEEAIARNACTVWVATNAAGYQVAGAVFFRFKDRFTMIFSGTSELARQVSALHLLIDKFIQQHAGKAGILDFEGSDNANLARFYKGFGSFETIYLKLVRNQLPVPFRWFK
ncbi:MAG TPA: GNAT family N-acetyltransferase [Bacteroidia bacterium]|nr:GNAT family N-acetyltransferase [Bacteroidia bacterium]